MDAKAIKKKNKHEYNEMMLSKCLKQYRVLQSDNVTYGSTLGTKFKSLMNNFKIAYKERNNISADLSVAVAPHKVQQDNKVMKNVKKLLEEYECLGKSVDEEKDQLRNLETNIIKTQKSITKLQKIAPTHSQNNKRIIKAKQTVELLENKLDKYTKTLNFTMAENVKIRKEIDHMLQERDRFNNLWYTFIKYLSDGKKFMLDLIEQATIVYDERDEWRQKIDFVREKGRINFTKQQHDMRKLNMILHNNEERNEYIGTKGQKRILKDLSKRQDKKSKIMKHKMEHLLEHYKEIFQNITDFYKEDNITEILKRFVDGDTENFGIFNYTMELNYDIEELCHIITHLKHCIEEQKALNIQRKIQQKEVIEKLRAKLQTEVEKVRLCENTVTKMDDNLEAMFVGIDDMFFILQCDDDPVLDLLFGLHGLEEDAELLEMTIYNVYIYLRLVEERITEVIQMVLNKENKAALKVKRGQPQPVRLVQPDVKSRYKRYNLTDLIPTQPCSLCSETEQVTDVIDTLQIVKNHENILEQTKLPHTVDLMHNVSACRLPQAKQIMQERFK